jgi:integrase
MGNKKMYESVKKILEKYPGGTNIQIGQINEKWLENFQCFLLNDCNLSKTTPSIYESVIRYALHKAVREKIIIDNPASRVKAIKKPESDRVFLSADEVKKLADIHVGGRLGSEIKKAFLFSCYTGLRISDLKTIIWGDIEHNPLQIIKKQKKTGRRVLHTPE